MPEGSNGGFDRQGAKPVSPHAKTLEKPDSNGLEPSHEALRTSWQITALVDYLHKRHGFFGENTPHTPTRQQVVKGECQTFAVELADKASELGFHAAKIDDWSAFPYPDGRPNPHALAIFRLDNGNYMSVDPTMAQVKGGKQDDIAEIFEGTLEQIQRHLQDRYGGSWDEVTKKQDGKSLVDLLIEDKQKLAIERKRSMNYLERQQLDELRKRIDQFNRLTIPPVLRSEALPYTTQELYRRELQNYASYVFAAEDMREVLPYVLGSPFFSMLYDAEVITKAIETAGLGTKFIEYLYTENIDKLPDDAREVFIIQVRNFLLRNNITDDQLRKLQPLVTELVNEGHLQIIYDKNLKRQFILPN